MKKTMFWLLGLLPFSLLAGCTAMGEKTASLSIIYGATAVLSFLLLIGYLCFVKPRDLWFVLLFSSVLVVNIGYFGLSVSRNLQDALWANRLAYLGSVFLPLSMLMSIIKNTGQSCKKWLSWVLAGLSLLVFFVAASPGFLPIYYREVSFEIVNGVSTLNKVYGPWHRLYLVYLLGYFGSMLAVIGYAIVKKKLETTAQAVFVLIAVFVNLGIWMIEQLVKLDFEILSVSYIISELFLLGVHLLLTEHEKLQSRAEQTIEIPVPAPEPVTVEDEIQFFSAALKELTPTERTVYELYVSGLGTKEVLEKLNIKENTLKYHNRNIYSKLGVSSRKQLLRMATLAEHKIP